MGGLPFLRSPLARKSRQEDETEFETLDETLSENPQFEHYAATSNIQLFFDLFFAANLSSFTDAHEINSGHSLSPDPLAMASIIIADTLSSPELRSYIGFFCILWFYWCQVTLYDVRFATDSVFQRVAHACHFGVMVGLAVIGPLFQNEDAWGPLQQLSILLMASRMVLFCQYGDTLFFTRKYRSTRTPLIVMMASLSVAFILYLGLSFAFYYRTAYHTYTAFYTIAVAEVAVNLAVAFWWQCMTFEKTHLVERMSCLTLIILGEGIIALTKTIGKVQNFDLKFSPAVIGTLISAVLIIYFIYQLYFDNVLLVHFGSARQQLWAGLHFPFHLALVLTMEGQDQILVWAHVVERLEELVETFTSLERLSPQTMLTKGNSTINEIFSLFPHNPETYNEVQTSITELLNPPPDLTLEQAIADGQSVIGLTAKVIVEGFGFVPPEQTSGMSGGLFAYANSITDVFSLTFGYFAVAAGAVLMLIAILTLLAYRHEAGHSILQYLSACANFIVGLGIALLSTMVLTDAAGNLGQTPWTIPALMLILLALLIFHHVSDTFRRPDRNDNQYSKIEK